MLIDSNIVIYAADPGDTLCGPYAEREDAVISTVTRIEVLGFPRFAEMSENQKERLEEIINTMLEAAIDEPVIRRAIAIRRIRRIGLADAVIAATALSRDIPLVTRNEEDFKDIPELTIINPFSDTSK